MYASSRLLLLLAVAVFYTRHHVCCGDDEVQWQIINKFNYSSHIRFHSRALLIVTVPWSGESRSLMKDLAHAVASEQVRFNTLKLMVLYRNMERMLADSLGANEGITIIYYHDTLPYRYRGKLRVQNILSSVHYVTTLSPNEIPLKYLTSAEGLNDFLRSTDKAVLLLEFCGWLPKLLAKDDKKDEKNQGSLGADFEREDNRILVSDEKNDRKGTGDNKLNFGVDSGFSWLSQFTSVNDSLMEAENMTFGSGVSCSVDEFHHFKLFLQKFLTIARDFFLPRERHRFAFVNDKSVLTLLKVEASGPYATVVSFSGCPSCLKVLREGDNLKTILQHSLPVVELEDDFHAVEGTLPARKPSALLFVDRSSDSMQIRTESHGALDAFRKFAEYHEISNKIHGLVTNRPGEPTIETNRALRNTLKHPFLQHFPGSQSLILKDKMSIVIRNDGKQLTLEDVVSDLQGNSMHELLTYALNRKKEMKLSSLAKDAGFQLLSKDFDIKVVESLPPNSEVKPDQILGGALGESIFVDPIDMDKNSISTVSSSGHHEKLLNPSYPEILLEEREESLDKSSQSSVKSEDVHHPTSVATDSAHNGDAEETRHVEVDDTIQHKYFGGSFFFIDGQTRLLETLTGQLNFPAVVIIDPIAKKHYVLVGQSTFSYSVLDDFVDDFLRGKLPPYQQSAPKVPGPREAPSPPFVNLDYHEKDSIPLLTAHTFAKLVLGNKSDTENSGHQWDKDILVLFGNSWCGFCQRMELVVREVHRAIKGYVKLKMNSSRMERSSLTEFVDDATSRLPLIYMMDCSQNDCGLITKPILQRELYPLLLLFPAERKDPVPYEGNIAVSDIIMFLATHGSQVLDLIIDKSNRHVHPSAKQVRQGRSLAHEVLVNDRLQNVELKRINSRFPIGLLERPQLSIGCILSATEKLLDVHPFDESKILLVKVEQDTGFQGLIVNKRISWDSLEEEGFDLLKEAALSFGGPVLRHGLPLVALTHKFIENQSVEVLQGIYFIDPWTTQIIAEEIRVGNKYVHDFWFFFGYSSWGWDQLFHEIAQGAWNIKNGSLEQLELPWA